MDRRIMGLDIGTRRIGVALSDPLFLTAQGLESYERRSMEADLEHMRELCEKYGVTRIVAGLPLHINGTSGEMADLAREFMDLVHAKTQIPFEFVDERLTTRQAERILIEADTSRRKRKKVIDKMAAVLILQTFLDRNALNNPLN